MSSLGWDWGTVPTWFSAIGTSGSLVSAVLLYRRSLNDRERAQASEISSWADFRHIIRRWGQAPFYIIFVENNSKLTITRPHLVMRTDRKDDADILHSRFVTVDLGQTTEERIVGIHAMMAPDRAGEKIELLEGEDERRSGINLNFPQLH